MLGDPVEEDFPGLNIIVWEGEDSVCGVYSGVSVFEGFCEVEGCIAESGFGDLEGRGLLARADHNLEEAVQSESAVVCQICHEAMWSCCRTKRT